MWKIVAGSLADYKIIPARVQDEVGYCNIRILFFTNISKQWAKCGQMAAILATILHNFAQFANGLPIVLKL